MNRKDFKQLLVEWNKNFVNEGLVKIDESYMNYIFEKCIAIKIIHNDKLSSSNEELKVSDKLKLWAHNKLIGIDFKISDEFAKLDFKEDSNLIIYIYNEKKEDAGSYDPIKKEISLSFSIKTNNLSKDKLVQSIESRSMPIYSSLYHEYLHHIQVTKSNKKNRYFGVSKSIKSIDDKDFKNISDDGKAHSIKSVEFYPLLYSHKDFYEKNIIMFNNNNFKKFISKSNFFNKLKKEKEKEFKKAVKVLYKELKNSKKVIRIKSKNLEFSHVKLLKELIDIDTNIYDEIEKNADFNKENTYTFLLYLFKNNYQNIKNVFKEEIKERDLEVLNFKNKQAVEELIKLTSFLIFNEITNIQEYTHMTSIKSI